MLNIKFILQRIGAVIKSQKNVDIAKALGVEPQVSNNWKARNTIPWDELFSFSIKNNVPLEWILTGTGSNQSSCPVQCDRDLRELCKKVKSVIDSGSEYADALKSNIVCFEKSVQLERRIDNLEKVSSGTHGGIAKPARLTVKKQKAG